MRDFRKEYDRLEKRIHDQNEPYNSELAIAQQEVRELKDAYEQLQKELVDEKFARLGMALTLEEKDEELEQIKKEIFAVKGELAITIIDNETLKVAVEVSGKENITQ